MNLHITFDATLLLCSFDPSTSTQCQQNPLKRAIISVDYHLGTINDDQNKQKQKMNEFLPDLFLEEASRAGGEGERSALLEYGPWSLLSIPTSFLIQYGLMRLLQTTTSAAFAVVTYYTIVKQRGSTSSYLIGYGVIIPASLWVPVALIEHFGIFNLAIMVGISAIGVLMPFFCIEAMYDTAEVGVETSLRSYVTYYCTIVPLKRDTKTGALIPITRAYIVAKGWSILRKMLLLFSLVGFLGHFDYQPFQVVPGPYYASSPSWSWLLALSYRYLHWTRLASNFGVAFLMGHCIDVGDEQYGLIVSLITGRESIAVMRHPMILSTSTADFWANRWNMTMHGSFKRGIVKPLLCRTGGWKVPRWVAVLLTFVISPGLLHEYICQVTQTKHQRFPQISTPYVARFGSQLCFFIWNGAVVLLEGIVPNKWKLELCWPFNTLLVLLTVLPVSHWFTDEYMRSGFYKDVGLGMPLLIYKQGT